MRHWLFHPLIFFPLACLIAAGTIFLSFGPRAFEMPAVAQTGRIERDSVILTGEALAHPESAPGQVIHIVGTTLGAARAIRIGTLPNQGPPTPEEAGVRLLLTPDTGARLSNKPVRVEITYRPVPIISASSLAVRLDGVGPQAWATGRLDAEQPGVVRFELPAQTNIDALAIRAISDNTDFNYGVEITQVRLTTIN